MWSFIGNVWNALVYEPLLNLLTFLTAIIPGHQFGIALLIMIVLVRFLMSPIIKRQLISLKRQQELQPELLEIKKQYKNNRRQAALAQAALFKEKGFNPFASIGYLLLQIPIILGLFGVIRNISKEDGIQHIIDKAYGFVGDLSWFEKLKTDPDIFNTTFLNLVDLTRITVDNGLYFAGLIVVILAAFTQYLTSKQMSVSKTTPQKTLRQLLKEQEQGKEISQAEMTAVMSKKMMAFIPLIIFIVSLFLFVALPFYFMINNVFQYFQYKRLSQPGEQAIKTKVDGQDTQTFVEKPLNAKQKKEQREKTAFRQSKTHRKKVQAQVKTVSKDKAKPKK